MVAIVAGNGVGLLTGSGNVLGSKGQVGDAQMGRGTDRIYLNATNGNLVIQGQDDALVGVGPDTIALRTYNSQGTFADDNGDNWSTGLFRRVYGVTGTANTAGSTVTRQAEDGSEAIYTWNASASRYQSFAGSGQLTVLPLPLHTWNLATRSPAPHQPLPSQFSPATHSIPINQPLLNPPSSSTPLPTLPTHTSRLNHPLPHSVSVR